ncbi:MAG: KH domain-containing protein [Eubacteriales bacterium]|nr:KH domain-containing protein [Eubacteriales bacterium]
MKEILEHILKSLVDEQDKIVVTEEKEGSLVKFKVKVSQNDFGKVIGKGGKIAKSIRLVMSAIATTSNEKVVVDIE